MILEYYESFLFYLLHWCFLIQYSTSKIELQMLAFYFYAKRFSTFLLFVNLDAQIRCLRNRYNDLKSALDQPLGPIDS